MVTHQTRENLDIIFRRVTPESVLEHLRQYMNGDSKVYLKLELPYLLSSFKEFDQYGVLNMQGYSVDEIRIRFDNLEHQWKESKDSIFCMLYEYADEVLDRKANEPICQIEQVLSWNSITLRLGQDLFTTAWLAYRDYKAGNGDKGAQYTFDWPYCLRTDDQRLNNIIKKGTAENHFHLGGSTQSFALSWASIMNHPNMIREWMAYENNFDTNLVISATPQNLTAQELWLERLKYAALIRGLLFQRCIAAVGKGCDSALEHGNCQEMLYERFSTYLTAKNANDIYDMVEVIRMLYGIRIPQYKEDKCLDYAMCGRLYRVDKESNNRILAGERALMYQCFMMVYSGGFSILEKTLFYIYLLIKSNFRGELIQINKRNGFYNFAQYQDRKSQLYEFLDEYAVEAQRLAISASMQENNIEVLEARIMPGNTKKQMAEKIKRLDKKLDFCSKEDKKRMFYVIHFAKRRFEMEKEDDSLVNLRPRNWRVRDTIKKQAKAVYEFKRDCSTLQDRLLGIDACSYEVGCRPETFATEFRFLRNCDHEMEAKSYLMQETKPYLIKGSKSYLMKESKPERLRVTYHAGEDFLDLCDGLRAMDEAIEYLELKNGDRIGHGLALGLDPEKYYYERYYSIYLSKQDYLDNCIWLLNRTLEWNVQLDSSHREFLKREAYMLLEYIYGIQSENQYRIENYLDIYYHSWFLRADHPELYLCGTYEEDKRMLIDPYDRYRTGKEEYKIYRNDDNIARLYYRYHYDIDVKKKGLEIIPIKIPRWYMDLVKELQKSMQRQIARKGICIECNPSSNYLIGYFGSYDHHPIFEFNNYILENDPQKPQIHVSINTDDLGVFDTSLSYEYALLYSAIRRKRHEEGCYNDEAIYDYLDYIRQSGLDMSFGNKELKKVQV